MFTKNNIVSDPCESVNNCETDKVTPKGTYVRGMGILYEYTTDQSVKIQIKQILKATVLNMLKTCDDDWNCGQDWLNGSPNKKPNIHYQMNAMELMNAFYKTFFSGPVKNIVVPTGLSSPAAVSTTKQNSTPLTQTVSSTKQNSTPAPRAVSTTKQNSSLASQSIPTEYPDEQTRSVTGSSASAESTESDFPALSSAISIRGIKLLLFLILPFVIFT